MHNHALSGAPLGMELKQLILDQMKETGSLAYTYAIVKRLEMQLDGLLVKVDEATGVVNGGLAMLLMKLRLA